MAIDPKVEAIDLHDANITPWPNASLEQVRDAILEGRIASIALDAADRLTSTPMLTYLSDHARDAVRAGRMIDAGFIPNRIIKTESLRAKTLVTEGWIGHPFREPWVLFHTWEEGAAPLVVMPDPDGGPATQIAELIPVAMQRTFRSLMVGDFVELVYAPGPQTSQGFIVKARVSPTRLIHAKTQEQTDQMMRDAACNVGDPVWTVLAMLATDGVEVESIPAPDRLNRQRAAKGKHPIPARQRVVSAPYITALLARAAGRPKAGAGGSGGHASPVMHLRRGHPRNLPNGRRTWVRDCIVNAADGSPVVRSHYAMKPGKENHHD